MAPYGEEGLSRQAYRPGFDVECCSGNVHRMFPNYISRMWMNGDEHEIVAALYGPSEYRTEINGTKVCITEDTSYPFSGKITFRFALDGAPVRIPFTMRIPSWVENAKLTVNAEQPKEYHAGGFSTIERRFKDGDVVELDIDMKPRAEKRTDEIGRASCRERV